MENGIRGYDIGLNPHSNGLDFCISLMVFFLKAKIIIVIIVNKIIITMTMVIIRLIFHLY